MYQRLHLHIINIIIITIIIIIITIIIIIINITVSVVIIIVLVVFSCHKICYNCSSKIITIITLTNITTISIIFAKAYLLCEDLVSHLWEEDEKELENIPVKGIISINDH